MRSSLSFFPSSPSPPLLLSLLFGNLGACAESLANIRYGLSRALGPVKFFDGIFRHGIQMCLLVFFFVFTVGIQSPDKKYQILERGIHTGEQFVFIMRASGSLSRAGRPMRESSWQERCFCVYTHRTAAGIEFDARLWSFAAKCCVAPLHAYDH